MGTGWSLLGNPRWTEDTHFGKYKTWGLTEGSNNWLDDVRKAMKVEMMSAEVKVLETLVNHLFDTH